MEIARITRSRYNRKYLIHGKGGKGLQLSFKFRFDVRYRYSNPIRCLGCCWKMGQTIARDVMRLR